MGVGITSAMSEQQLNGCKTVWVSLAIVRISDAVAVATKPRRYASAIGDQGQPKGASRVNTDHKYMGIRFYFESDNVWSTKIKQ